MNRKNAVGFLAILMILTILGSVVPVLAQGTLPQYDSAWHSVVNGVLAADTYTLYPYAAKSLNVGFSKYGELIGITAGLDTSVAANWVGLEYDGRDPFCNPAIPMNAWINGWLIDISYTNPVSMNPDRKVWAHALFTDGVSGGQWGYDWTFVSYSTLPYGPIPTPHVGRKSNTYVETEAMQVLYHGPRRFVALLKTHIYDWEDADVDGVRDLGTRGADGYFADGTGEVWRLIDIYITLIFNKDKKEVLLLKDIKLTLSPKYLEGKVDVQFSEREEWDLGPAATYDSYIHFYNQSRSTCYGREWHLVNYTLRKYIDLFTAAAGQMVFNLNKIPVEPQSEKVYVNGVLQRKVTVGAAGPDYSIVYSTGVVTFSRGLSAGDVVRVEYKQQKQLWDHHYYDIIQVISSDKKKVGWEAMWPCLSDWTVDGWGLRTTPLINVSVSDASVEPKIPFTIKEWDFMLGFDDASTTPLVEGPPHYRVVEVKGVTDYHDASDTAMGYGYTDTLDREVCYQLDEIFDPWDIYSAVHKDTKRWVEYMTTGTTKTLSMSPVPDISDAQWDQYCQFSERVETAAGVLLHRRANDPEYGGTDDYDWTVTAGIATITLKVTVTYPVKILYSTRPAESGRYEWITVGQPSAAVDSAGAAMVSEYFDSKKEIEVWMSGLDMQDTTFGPKIPYIFAPYRTTLLPAKAGYRNDDWGACKGRSGINDDWCTTVPISTSNIIVVGGFYANLGAEYLNEFTNAYIDPSTDYIMALSCWSRDSSTHKYKPTYVAGIQTVGYAVITTYKDLNETAWFAVWGYTGQDTYYACWTIWNTTLGTKLQTEPYCMTSMIIKFNYALPCLASCFWEVVETLGTISEYNNVVAGVQVTKQPLIHPDP